MSASRGDGGGGEVWGQGCHCRAPAVVVGTLGGCRQGGGGGLGLKVVGVRGQELAVEPEKGGEGQWAGPDPKVVCPEAGPVACRSSVTLQRGVWLPWQRGEALYTACCFWSFGSAGREGGSPAAGLSHGAVGAVGNDPELGVGVQAGGRL